MPIASNSAAPSTLRRRLAGRAAPAMGALALAVVFVACGRPPHAGYGDYKLREIAVQEAPPEELEVPPPPFSDPDIFPCSSCHADQETDRTRRELDAPHDEIVLRHDAEHRWCLDCHDADNRDQLHLASGEPVKFEESYKLCGQCHGEKLRDWKAGVHGRRVGKWNGHKRYLLCAHCHDPHQPHFKPLQPKPAPRRPEAAGIFSKPHNPSAEKTHGAH